MQKQSKDEGFFYLEKPIMHLLTRPRTKNNVRDIIKLIHPILDYYIKFYLYKYGIYDNHQEHLDFYGDAYVFCCELLYSVKGGDNNFNRIKRYINKSVGGWLYNKVYKKKKKAIELTKDDLAIALQVDYRDDYGQLNHDMDMRSLKAHVESEMNFYFEMCSILYGNSVLKNRGLLRKKYYEAAFELYLDTGVLLDALDFFENKYGNIFHESESGKECYIGA